MGTWNGILLTLPILICTTFVGLCFLYNLALSAADHVIDNRQSPSQADDNAGSGSRQRNDQKSDAGSSNNDPALWPGHMDFFGASGSIEEIDSVAANLEPHKLFNEYILVGKPVAMRESARHFPAATQWQRDNQLLSRPQSFSTVVTALDEELAHHEVTFRRFLQSYMKKNWHIDAEVPLFMWDDIYLPGSSICIPTLKRLSQNLLWYSGREIFQPLFQRYKDSIKCVISGNVEITLVDPVKFADRMPKEVTDIDVNAVDLTRFPGLRGMEFERSLLSPGDCIYLPGKWFQQVNTFGRTITVDVTFRRHTESVTEKDCRASASNRTLSQYDFQDQLVANMPDLDVFLHRFITYVSEKAVLPLEKFKELLKKDRQILANMTEWTDEFEGIAKELFQSLDLDLNERFTLEDVDNLTQTDVERLRGLLADRILDFKDIIDDQQEDVQASSEKAMDPLTQAFITQYVEELEGVLVQSIDQFVQTGTMPDIKAKMSKMDVKQQMGLGSGGSGTAEQTDETGNTEHYTSREDAKAKLKARREKREAEKAANQKADPEKKDEEYVFVEDESTEEEEIIAEEEREEDRAKSGTVGTAERPEKSEAGKTETSKQAEKAEKAGKPSKMGGKTGASPKQPEKPKTSKGSAKDNKEKASGNRKQSSKGKDEL